MQSSDTLYGVAAVGTVPGDKHIELPHCPGFA
jgi:hypothetical protein